LLVPNAGAACVVDDVPLPFHGEWSRTAVEVVAHDAASVTLNAGARLPLVVHRRVAVLTEPSRVDVTTTVENLVDHALPFVWGEHPAFQAAPGDRIDLPGGNVVSADAPGTPVPWPDSPATTADLDRVAEDVPLQGVHYLPERPAGWAALRRPHVGVGLAWDVADFPHVWLWHEIGGPEFPFFGRTSLVAIEPASSWPGDGLAAAIERGQAHWLAPRSSRTTTVTLVPFRPVGRPVTNVERGGTVTFEEGAA
jgi:galactose mutarotase-like enzyme